MNVGGHGLGLSICQKIAECLNGEIIVSSKQGIGTKITYCFLSPADRENDPHFVDSQHRLIELKMKNARRKTIDWKKVD